MQSILITGANGYVGSYFVKKFKQIETYNVYGLDTSIDEEHKIDFFLKDINDIDEDYLKDLSFDYVIHAAALVPLSNRKKDFHNVNSYGTQKVYEWALKRNCKHFIYISSSAVIGIQPKLLPYKEDIKPKPFEVYGKSKYLGEQLIQGLPKESDSMKLAIVRPRTVLGENRLGVFSVFFEWILNNNVVFLLGGKHQKYQFAHIEDLFNLVSLILINKNSGIFHCGSKACTNFPDEIKALIRESSSNSKIVVLPKFFRILGYLASILGLTKLSVWHFKAYSESFYFDLSETQNSTGWKPKYSNQDILLSAYNDFIKLNSEKIKTTSIHKNILNEKLIKFITTAVHKLFDRH